MKSQGHQTTKGQKAPRPINDAALKHKVGHEIRLNPRDGREYDGYPWTISNGKMASFLLWFRHGGFYPRNSDQVEIAQNGCNWPRKKNSKMNIIIFPSDQNVFMLNLYVYNYGRISETVSSYVTLLEGMSNLTLLFSLHHSCVLYLLFWSRNSRKKKEIWVVKCIYDVQQKKTKIVDLLNLSSL